jgi:hypothetical protein
MGRHRRKGEIMDAALNELEEMVAKLQEAARKLSPSPSRQSLLQEIG